MKEDSIRFYLEEIGKFPLLKPEEEIELAIAIAQAANLSTSLGDRTPTNFECAILRKGKIARDKMINSNMRLVAAIGKRYQGRGLDYTELMQEGMLGLIKAVEKFDHTKGYKFSTYAYWWIRQAITRAIADKSRTLRLPIYVTESLNKIRKAVKDLSLKFGRTPSKKEIAEHLRWEEEKLEMFLEHQRTGNVNSLNINYSSEKGKTKEIGDLVTEDNAIAVGISLSPDEYLAEVEKSEMIAIALLMLTPNERDAVILRFGKEYSLQKASDIMGISRERVRQLQIKALNKMRKHLNAWNENATINRKFSQN